MSPQARKLVLHGFIGMVFGIAFYLTVSSIAKLFLDWFVPYVEQRFPLEEPIVIKAIYAVAITLSWGIRIPFNFISTDLSLLLTSVVSGVIGMASFLFMGIRRGAFIFLVLFAILFLPLAFLGFVMIVTG